jgi:hypothetical protein
LDSRAIEKLLYQQSGLLGVSGISSDMRTLLASHEERATPRPVLGSTPRRSGNASARQPPGSAYNSMPPPTRLAVRGSPLKTAEQEPGSFRPTKN